MSKVPITVQGVFGSDFNSLVREDICDVFDSYPKDFSDRLPFPPVLTKRDFVRRYGLGEFGNRSPTWETLDQFLASEYRGGLLHLRNRIAGGETFYNLSQAELIAKWESVSSPSLWYCSAMAPHHRGLIQGEIQVGVRGLELFYAPALLPMREALEKEGKQVSGLLASSLLKSNLCPNSLEWLEVLINRYPGHVLEFSSFDCYWGTLPRFNTVWWEVRGGY